jgi:hypothetical protein
MPQSGVLYGWVGNYKRETERETDSEESDVSSDATSSSDLDFDNCDVPESDAIVSRFLYGTVDEAKRECRTHMKYYDSTRSYTISTVPIIYESPSELNHKRDLAKIEAMLKVFYTHDIGHCIRSLLARTCEGCVCLDIHYRKHGCHCPPEEMVTRFYDQAFDVLDHKQLIESFISEMKRGSRDLFPHVNELTFYRYLPGSDYRRRFIDHDFHTEVKMMVTSHLRLMLIPTAPACAYPGMPASAKVAREQRERRNAKRVRSAPRRSRSPRSHSRSCSPPASV